MSQSETAKYFECVTRTGTDSAQEPITLGSCSAGGQHPGDELAVLYTIVQRDLRYTKMAATAAVSFL